MKYLIYSLLVGFILIAGCAMYVEATHPFSAIKLTIQKLSGKNRLVFQTKHWIVELKREQTYLGGCTIRLKRPVGSFSNLTKEEWEELHLVMKALEHSTKKAFGATLVNWYGLMNYAYRVKPYMPLVHVHFFPRYEKPVTFLGTTFEDPDFGNPLDYPNNRRKVDKATERAIIRAIQDNLP